MLQKALLGLLLLGLICWISSDLHKISRIKKDSVSKLSYLESLNSDQGLGVVYEIIRDSYRKPSLWRHCHRFLELDSKKISMDGTLDYEYYIHFDDLQAFNKEICKIPDLIDKESNLLNRVRNKIILRSLLDYAAQKIGLGGVSCCFGRYQLIKDVFNNITLSDSCGFFDCMLTINGVVIENNTPFPIKLLKANHLFIEMSGVQDHRILRNEETCHSANIDLQALIK